MGLFIFLSWASEKVVALMLRVVFLFYCEISNLEVSKKVFFFTIQMTIGMHPQITFSLSPGNELTLLRDC